MRLATFHAHRAARRSDQQRVQVLVLLVAFAALVLALLVLSAVCGGRR